MWWTLVNAWPCEPTMVESVRTFPANAASGVPVDASPAVLLSGAEGDWTVGLVDAEGKPVATTTSTEGGFTVSPADGQWLVTLVPESDLLPNATYRVVVDRGDVHEESSFHTGTSTGGDFPGGDDPVLVIKEVAAPLSSDDPCDWPSSTRYVLHVDPGTRFPRGVVMIRRTGEEGASGGDLVWAGPADHPDEIELSLATDPARSCFGISVRDPSGQEVEVGARCADVPPAPRYEDNDTSGKTSGGHGCATVQPGLVLLIAAGLLIRRR